MKLLEQYRTWMRTTWVSNITETKRYELRRQDRIRVYKKLMDRHGADTVLRHSYKIARILDRVETDVIQEIAPC